MAADQAAGLRRRGERHPLRCIHCHFDSAASIIRLAHALHEHDWTALLVDMQGRLYADSSTRSLFDWRQQIARGPLHLHPMPCGDAWHAPGVRADEPALRRAALGYDLVLFDAASGGGELALMPNAAHAVIMEIQPSHASMQQAYAFLKTLSYMQDVLAVYLLGNSAACDLLRNACSRFLHPAFAQAICCAAHEDDAFAELAVRMAGEEASRNGSLQHRETLNGW